MLRLVALIDIVDIIIPGILSTLVIPSERRKYIIYLIILFNYIETYHAYLAYYHRQSHEPVI